MPFKFMNSIDPCKNIQFTIFFLADSVLESLDLTLMSITLNGHVKQVEGIT